ncbi:TniB family NTP-binding protein [Pseudomonas sp. SK2]|uniref:TniB family NTP-binding protein n=1 Tax=Pseudomonas sp. SK2 TaxID=2841063 RepID=UPI00192A8DBD|nr:TniB family NTP-binding protein [Pseudomonas sp. SK2]QQZ36358.1 TniB family NTP-binding protein [Pseudomonas sp. SK2]
MNATESQELTFSLRHRFIHSPQAVRALTRLSEVHRDSRRTGASNGLLIKGPSGVGKSTLILEYIRSLEEIGSVDDGKRTVLFVEIPSSPTKKNLAAAMLTALKDPFATARGHSAEVKFARVVLLLKNLGVEVVALDEVQHLVDYRRNGAYEAADWIKSLMNETSITFVLLGLKRTEGLLTANEQLRRRFSATVDYDRFTLTAKSSVHFVMLLRAIQGELPVQTVSFTEATMIKRFHLASYGLIDYLMKIVDRAVWLVHYRGLAGIELPVLAEAFEDEVWSNSTDERNPFSATFNFQPLIGKYEPFEKFEEF